MHTMIIYIFIFLIPSLRSFPINMEQYIDRLVSFSTLPDNILIPTVSLTENGFHYTGISDKVECHCCHVTLQNWQRNDDPLRRHLHNSPDCQFALSRARELGGVNLERSIGDLSLDHDLSINEQLHGMHMFDEIIENDDPESHKHNNLIQYEHKQGKETENINEPCFNSTWCQGTLNSFGEQYSNEIIDFTILSNRISSYTDKWPCHSPVSPKELAEAGLYYVGPDDRVQCAWCGGGIYNWEDGDTAIGEHKKHFPKCPFIQEKIDELLYVNCNYGSKTNTGLYDDKKYELLNRVIENHPAVVILLEMDFEPNTVYAAARKMLNDANINLTTDNLLEEIYRTEREQQEGSSSTSNNTTATSLEGAVGYASGYTGESHYIQNQNTIPENIISTPSVLTTNLEQNNNKTRHVNENQRNNIIHRSWDNNHISEEDLCCDLLKLSEENEQMKDKTTCKVCLDKNVETLFLPCRHLVCCEECAERVGQCPMCRETIIGTVKTFLQ